MEDGRGERRTGAGLLEYFGQMQGTAGTSGGNHRHRHRLGSFPQLLEVIPVAGPVAVHAGEQDLPGAEIFAAPHPFDGVPSGRNSPARHHDLETATRRAARIHRQHQTLRPELTAGLGEEFRPLDGSAVHGNLVGARPEQGVHVGN